MIFKTEDNQLKFETSTLYDDDFLFCMYRENIMLTSLQDLNLIKGIEFASASQKFEKPPRNIC